MGKLDVVYQRGPKSGIGKSFQTDTLMVLLKVFLEQLILEASSDKKAHKIAQHVCHVYRFKHIHIV